MILTLMVITIFAFVLGVKDSKNSRDIRRLTRRLERAERLLGEAMCQADILGAHVAIVEKDIAEISKDSSKRVKERSEIFEELNRRYWDLLGAGLQCEELPDDPLGLKS